MMIGKLKKIYLRALFRPRFLAIFLNPFFFGRRGLYLHMTELCNHLQGKTLDIGCGTKPYRDLCRSDTYVGLELDTPKNRKAGYADVFYDGNALPFSANEFDSILCNQVLEHVFTPEPFLAEAFRVLRSGGNLLLTVPFAWDEHEQPLDYARYSSFGIAALVQRCGFEVVEQRKSVDDIRAVVQLFTTYVHKKTVTQNVYVNVITTTFLIAPFTILGIILGVVLPKNKDLYLDNILLLRKPSDA